MLGPTPEATMAVTREREIVAKLATQYTREMDDERPVDLVLEIQKSLGCSWGRALCLSNDVRLLFAAPSQRA